MRHSRRLAAGSILSLLAFATLLSGAQVYRFKAPEFSLVGDPDGFQRVVMADFPSYGLPGFPDLPSYIYLIALPPDLDPDTVAVDFTPGAAVPLGKQRIREIPALATWDDGRQVFAGKAGCYGHDAFFPTAPVELVGFGQLRKWKVARVKFTPFQYNPVTQELIHVPEVRVEIRLDRSALRAAPALELTDQVMDARAARKIWNFDEAKSWYTGFSPAPRASQAHDYAIITTSAIQAASTKLGDFLAFLMNKGHNPLVVTESDFGGLTGQSPNGTAEKIRQWLRDNYLAMGIEYVLLIGNPNPAGNIPMKMCWPRWAEASYRESPTDYFFADLTGNWDLDGDGYFGEYPDDDGTGGVDFLNEVYVGRIPVYSGVATLDSVLTKIIAYGTSANVSWRRSALLPMSYSDSTTDGAYLGEAMKSNFLSPAGFSSWTLYMQGGVCAAANSSFASSEELLTGATKARWTATPFGLVWWWGHGSETSAALGYSGCGWGTILSTGDAPALNDNYPAFVYQCSCLNGYPETSTNLGAALLTDGAVATVSASRVSWYAVTSWSTGLKYYCDNASLGYYYGQSLVSQQKGAAVALYDVKSDMGQNGGWWGPESWMNLFDFNLYGEPTTSLLGPDLSHLVSTPTSPAGVAEGVAGVSYGFTTGGSACSLGHGVEYRFDWGDGSFSVWGDTTSRSHSWPAADAYNVRAQARCALDLGLVSAWSTVKMVVISAGVGPYTLQILPSSDGTTNPVPGSYLHNDGEPASVQANPDPGYTFSYWQGNVPENKISQNPLSLTMDGDKVITPHFLISTWSSPSVNLSQTAALSTTPRLAANGSSLHAIWIEGGLLYYRRSTNGGTTWSSKTPLTSGGDINEGSYGIAIAASGNYVHIVMSWRNLPSEDHDIHYLRSTNGGVSFGAWAALTNDSFETRVPDIGVYGPDVHVVYSDLSTGNWDIMYLKIEDYGTGATSSRRISFTAPGISYKPQLAVSPDGALVHIVYTDTDSGVPDIFYVRLEGGGSGVATSRKLTAGGGSSRYPDIAVSSSGDLQYVYISYISDWPGNNDVMLKRLAGFGLGEMKTLRLSYSAGDSVYPRIATAGENVYVVYADLTSGHWMVFSKKIPNYGYASFLTKQISYGSGNSEYPDIFCLAGKAHTIWSDNSSGNYEILYKFEL